METKLARVWEAFKRAFFHRKPCSATWGEDWKQLACERAMGHEGRHRIKENYGYFEW